MQKRFSNQDVSVAQISCLPNAILIRTGNDNERCCVPQTVKACIREYLQRMILCYPGSHLMDIQFINFLIFVQYPVVDSIRLFVKFARLPIMTTEVTAL